MTQIAVPPGHSPQTGYTPVDIERLIIEFFETIGEIANRVPKPLVTDVVPENKTWPLITVQQVSSRTIPHPAMWVEDSDIQVNVWADTHQEVVEIAGILRRAAGLALPGQHAQGVVGQVDIFNASYRPDQDVPVGPNGQSRPRFLFTLSCRNHPRPDGPQ